MKLEIAKNEKQALKRAEKLEVDTHILYLEKQTMFFDDARIVLKCVVKDKKGICSSGNNILTALENGHFFKHGAINKRIKFKKTSGGEIKINSDVM